MKFIQYTPWVSPHQVPLAKELVKVLGVDNFRYVYTEDPSPHQLKWGWDKLIAEPWMMKTRADDPILTSCEVLLTGVRDLGLMAQRAAKGLKTFYMSERWFKPIRIGGAEGLALPLPGIARMWVPRFRKMAKGFVKLVNESESIRFLPIGPWAKKDFLRIGVKEEKMIDWGYFVAPSANKLEKVVAIERSEIAEGLHGQRKDNVLKVLWAGRDIPLKRVRDIEKAVRICQRKGLKVEFTKLTGVSGEEVRKAMREHDTFVFASDAYEGWGAVVSEALEEGMNVIGTWECGACPTLLPKERLYHAGDVRELARLLELELDGRVGDRRLPACSIGEWTAEKAAKRLVGMCNG